MRRGVPALALAFGLAAAAVSLAAFGQSTMSAPAPAQDSSQVERGRYLVTAGDCAGCHTRPGGEAFAGGMGFKTSFGTIYSVNITPDRGAGIGGWTQDQFWRAMHEGRRADGAHLYPAFPYTYYTRVTREDSDAILTYLRTVTPSAYQAPANKLLFPVNIRGSMGIWNALYFKPGVFQPQPDRSAEWNRGAYLVTGLGHCGACHTPKNLLSADSTKRPLQGGKIEDWFAPDLDSAARGGLASWSTDDIVEFLKTGRNAHSNGSASMASVITHSTSQLSGADLHAIAVYLKSLPASADASPRAPSVGVMAAGAAIYADQCSACHAGDGSGAPRLFPPLAGNANVQSADATTIVRYILSGTQSVATGARPTPSSMPSFAWKLNDDEVAAVATFIRNSGGNSAPPVTAGEVARLRHKIAEPPIRKALPPAQQR
jgi:mono/diheme cytochrome c family protein